MGAKLFRKWAAPNSGAMEGVILFIGRTSTTHLSVHEDDQAALAALERYVEENWDDAKLSARNREVVPGGNIDAWMGATGAFYVIAEVSIGEEP